MHKLDEFTRRLEECRMHWNQKTLNYVLASGRILTEARETAGETRSWLQWLKKGPHMDRATATRHMRVCRYLKENDALLQHFSTLSLSKVYALVRINPEAAAKISAREDVRSMNERDFANFIRDRLPSRKPRTSHDHGYRTLMGALARVKALIERMASEAAEMPPTRRQSVLNRVREIHRTATHVRYFPRKAL